MPRGLAAITLLALGALIGSPPAEARGGGRQLNRRVAVGRSRTHIRRRAGVVPAPIGRGWGTTVYGASHPSVYGTCVDPYDPDPIGGPEHVGDGGPGAFLGRCNGSGRFR